METPHEYIDDIDQDVRFSTWLQMSSENASLVRRCFVGWACWYIYLLHGRLWAEQGEV